MLWYAQERSCLCNISTSDWPIGNLWIKAEKMRAAFMEDIPYYFEGRSFQGDGEFSDANWRVSPNDQEGRFTCYDAGGDIPAYVEDHIFGLEEPWNYVIVEDRHQGTLMALPRSLLRRFFFDLDHWYCVRLAKRAFEATRCDVWNDKLEDGTDVPVLGFLTQEMVELEDAWLHRSFCEVHGLFRTFEVGLRRKVSLLQSLEVNAIADELMFSAIQRNAATVKDPRRRVPWTVVITVELNGHLCRALVDTGSMGDFVSSTLADQLGLKKIELVTPLALQLAVQGSRSKINFGVRCQFKYQSIQCKQYFDIANLSNYDVILGTPWLFQHQISVGFNKSPLVVGSTTPLKIEGPAVGVLESRATVIYDEALTTFRMELIEYARPLFKKAGETPLPPLQAINHPIPLIDPEKVYPWRPSHCPEMFREQWDAKRKAYIETGQWKITTASNTVPMLLIRKPGTVLLHTVVDLHARNANTKKMASPLPDIDGILCRVACAKYFSLMDSSDAYEQVHVVPEHVPRTTVLTPDGNMVSLVMQQGDCNAPATFQAIMNHIFSPYIGCFMDMYLDDLIVYSDTLEDHMRHVKLIIDILKKEKFYLGENKVHFLAKELKVLGRIVDHHGIRMDPDKVNAIVKWPTPTSKELLMGFLGSLGYLADDIAKVWIPMGHLTTLTGSTVPFRWTYTEQRAFQDCKSLTNSCRDHHPRAA